MRSLYLILLTFFIFADTWACDPFHFPAILDHPGFKAYLKHVRKIEEVVEIESVARSLHQEWVKWRDNHPDEVAEFDPHSGRSIVQPTGHPVRYGDFPRFDGSGFEHATTEEDVKRILDGKFMTDDLGYPIELRIHTQMGSFKTMGILFDKDVTHAFDIERKHRSIQEGRLGNGPDTAFYLNNQRLDRRGIMGAYFYYMGRMIPSGTLIIMEVEEVRTQHFFEQFYKLPLRSDFVDWLGRSELGKELVVLFMRYRNVKYAVSDVIKTLREDNDFQREFKKYCYGIFTPLGRISRKSGANVFTLFDDIGGHLRGHTVWFMKEKHINYRMIYLEGHLRDKMLTHARDAKSEDYPFISQLLRTR